MTPEELRLEIINDLASFTHDPLGFVMWAYPWGQPGALAEETGPDEWQAEQLRAVGERLRKDPFEAVQDAIASGHGIGKSAEVCWLIHWALMTHEDTRGVVTANTDTQLRTKTWAELSKWHGLLLPTLRDMFKLEATSIHSTQKGHERTWRIDAIPWSETNTEAFAGLHNAGKRVAVIFDEASAIADSIWDTIAGALTDAGTEILFFAYGNPTRNTGRFKENVAGRFRHRWRSRQIDSRTVKRTNKALLDGWVKDYGDDSDFVRVRVKGQFPRAGSTQFIGSDLVQEARKREPLHIPSDALVWGVDVARYGDDQSVLAQRRGRDARSLPWRRWRGVSTMQLAGDIATDAAIYRPDAIFVDVGGVGGGVVDRLMQLNVANVIPINFGSAGGMATWANEDKVSTANKRAFMWAMMRAWLRGGALPDDDDLEQDLTGVEYGFNADNAIQLEKKEDMKKRGLSSPDNGDALALTFAQPVAPRAVLGFANAPTGLISEYDPHG